MSGDAGGALIGLALALAAAPALIAGAAVIGTAYAAYKAGGYLVNAAKEHHQKVQLEIDNCSSDLKKMYSSINQAVDNASKLQYEYNVKAAQRMEAISREIEAITSEDVELGSWNKRLDEGRRELERSISLSASETSAEIKAQFRRSAAESISVIKKEQSLKADIVDFKSKKASDIAQAKAVAALSLGDARATVKLLSGLSGSSADKELHNKAAIVSSNLARVEDAFNNGLYEASLTGANNIVTEGALIAADFAAASLERGQAVLEYQTKIVALLSELESRRMLTVTLECGDKETVDLADFSQGMYERAEAQLKEKLRQSQTEWDNVSLETVRAGIQTCDMINTDSEDISVARIIDVATERMQSYYQKLAALDIVSEYMEAQGFSLDWAQPVGDDITQKLVIGFSNTVTGNTISVSIDTEGKIDDMCSYVMELAYYYNNDRPVTEQEKARLRSGLNAALSEKGLRGLLDCTGSYDMSSGNEALSDADKVKAAAPENIYRKN